MAAAPGSRVHGHFKALDSGVSSTEDPQESSRVDVEHWPHVGQGVPFPLVPFLYSKLVESVRRMAVCVCVLSLIHI